jgi:hypothetical protein
MARISGPLPDRIDLHCVRTGAASATPAARPSTWPRPSLKAQAHPWAAMPWRSRAAASAARLPWHSARLWRPVSRSSPTPACGRSPHREQGKWTGLSQRRKGPIAGRFRSATSGWRLSGSWSHATRPVTHDGVTEAVRHTLRTCLAQDFDDYEVVVCDNHGAPAQQPLELQLRHVSPGSLAAGTWVIVQPFTARNVSGSAGPPVRPKRPRWCPRTMLSVNRWTLTIASFPPAAIVACQPETLRSQRLRRHPQETTIRQRDWHSYC